MNIVNVGRKTFEQFLEDSGRLFASCSELGGLSGEELVRMRILPETENEFNGYCTSCGQEYRGPKLIEMEPE